MWKCQHISFFPPAVLILLIHPVDSWENDSRSLLLSNRAAWLQIRRQFRQRQRKVSVSDSTKCSNHQSSLLLLMPLFGVLVFTPLTSSPLNLPSFYLSTNTRLTNQRQRRKGDSHTPAPSAGFVPAPFKNSLHKLHPREEGPDQRAATYCPSGHCICNVQVFPTAWPLFTISCFWLCIHGNTPVPHCQTRQIAEEVWSLVALCCFAPSIHYGGKRHTPPPRPFQNLATVGNAIMEAWLLLATRLSSEMRTTWISLLSD